MKLSSLASLKRPDLLSSPFAQGQDSNVSGPWFDVFNPADDSLVGRAPLMGEAQIDAAIDRASAAFTAWSVKTATERSVVLKRWFNAIEANAADLAAIMTAEQGKPFSEALGEIAYAASFVEWFAEEAKRVYGDIVPTPQPGKRILVFKQPIGVCAAITPWNFPAAMITRKVAPALAAGCTMIVKPAEQTPLTAMALGRLAHEAGIPAGVLQIVTGKSRVIGHVLTASPLVRKLSFTGSTQVGRMLMAQSAPTIKKLSLELGGNAPFIVFEDADLDLAVEGAIAAKYRNAGQTCVCANRFYVQAGVYESFAARFAERVKQMRAGDGAEQGVTIGPLIDDAAIDKVETLVADAVAKGAKVLAGGRRHARGGRFYEPTVLGEANSQMLVAQEEIFGPVAPLFRFQTEEEALKLANDTEYGLAAYFYTEDARRVWRVSERLEFGIVGHNTGVISNEVAPFGGWKQSGLGREGSRYGIEEYIEIKYLCSAIA